MGYDVIAPFKPEWITAAESALQRNMKAKGRKEVSRSERREWRHIDGIWHEILSVDVVTSAL